MSDQPPEPASFELVLLDQAIAFVDPLVQRRGERGRARRHARAARLERPADRARDHCAERHEDAASRIEQIIEELSAPDAEITLGTLVNSLVATEELVQAIIAMEQAVNHQPPGFSAFPGQLPSP